MSDNKKIIIYSTRICPFCSAAKNLLDSLGLKYDEIIIGDALSLDEMIRKSNGRRTMPQIFINDYHVGGYDDLKNLVKDDKLKNFL